MVGETVKKLDEWPTAGRQVRGCRPDVVPDDDAVAEVRPFVALWWGRGLAWRLAMQVVDMAPAPSGTTPFVVMRERKPSWSPIYSLPFAQPPPNHAELVLYTSSLTPCL
jgi:hypothetical protein